MKGRLIDYYGEFQSSPASCKHCSWTGLGSDMESGDSFGEGVDKHCPKCGERWGFVQYSVTVADEAP